MPNLNPSGLQWDDLIGKKLLIGLTYTSKDGKVLEQSQLHGRVASASEHTGILVKLDGLRAGESYKLPPDLRSFFPAKAGEYTLRSTGEVVVDPDFMANWIVTKGSGAGSPSIGHSSAG
jgi:hypothetical protein